MTMRMRLKRLEIKARRMPQAKDRWDDLRDEDWLALFQAWGGEGHFAREPDFPVALAFYHDAIQHAKTRTDPPFDPPSDFLPNLRDSPHLRLVNWRNKVRFPDVNAGWDWLMEMLRRVQEGIPPLSAAEFEELARWFQANEERLYQLSLPSQLLELGGGRSTSVTNLRYGLRQGVRASGAAGLTENLRRLRARYREEAS